MADFGDVEEGALDVGDTGEKLDTTVVEQTDGTKAHREAVVAADPIDNDLRARVSKNDDPTLAGQVVRVAGFDVLIDQMDELLKIQRGMLRLLEVVFEDGLSARDEESQ